MFLKLSSNIVGKLLPNIAISRLVGTKLNKALDVPKKKALIDSYFYSNFNYCPIVWMLSSAKSKIKLNLCRRGPYVFCMKTMLHRMRSYCKKLGKRL